MTARPSNTIDNNVGTRTSVKRVETIRPPIMKRSQVWCLIIKDGQIESIELVDSSGSVQIPREVLDQLSIKRRVRLNVTDGRVTLESGE